MSHSHDNDPVLDDTSASMVVIDGLPIVKESKFDKLKRVVRKIFETDIGAIVECEMPLENGQTQGFMFVEYEDPSSVERALRKDKFMLDKDHELRVNKLCDFERLADLKKEYTPPTEEEIRKNLPPASRADLKWWVSDKLGRDMYCIKYGEDVAMCWNDSREKPHPIHTKTRWTETYTQWSPHGTMLATFHAQGIILWGGPEFEQLYRFAHSNVRRIHFSPCEKYLVTASAAPVDRNDPEALEPIVIWEIRTGKKMRGFHLTGVVDKWPLFKWESNDKYFARLVEKAGTGKKQISVYETETFGLVGKKRLPLLGVQDFEWCPTDPFIAAWTPEEGNIPARVVVIQIPDKKEIAQKILYNVKECRLHWHNQGKYLMCKVDRMNKSGKTFYVNFELFRMKEKNYPVENIVLTDTVSTFEWEPNGDRFAIIHAANADMPRPDVSFYTCKGSNIELLKKLDKKACNHLYWSPQGQFIVLAGLGFINGQLEWWNVDTMEMTAADDHLLCTNIEWESTGRYLATCVSAWHQQQENGYRIWSFCGEQVHAVNMERFYQFAWRPRPPSLLTAADLKLIKKNLHKRSKEYEKIDILRTTAIDDEAKEKKKKQRDDFERLMDKRRKELEQLEAERIKLFGAPLVPNDSDQWVEITETVEEIIEEKFETIED